MSPERMTEVSVGALGIQTGCTFIWNAKEELQDAIHPGVLVNLCFGEIGWGGMPKRRWSPQWVVVLERDGNQFRGITLEDGWMTGPVAHTLIRFSKDQVCKVGDPGSVAKELRKTRAWQAKELERPNPDVIQSPSSTDDCGDLPF